MNEDRIPLSFPLIDEMQCKINYYSFLHAAQNFSMSCDDSIKVNQPDEELILHIFTQMLKQVVNRVQQYKGAGINVKTMAVCSNERGNNNLIAINLEEGIQLDKWVRNLLPYFKSYVLSAFGLGEKGRGRPIFRFYFKASNLPHSYCAKIEYEIKIDKSAEGSFVTPANCVMLMGKRKVIDKQRMTYGKIEYTQGHAIPYHKIGSYKLKEDSAYGNRTAMEYGSYMVTTENNIVKKEEEKKNMKKFNGFKDMFVFEEVGCVGINMLTGKLAIKTNEGTAIEYTSTLSEDGAIENLMEVPADMLIEFPAYVVSTQLSAIKAGDAIKHKGEYGFISEINGSEIVYTNLKGEKVTYNIPQNMFFGNMKMIPKVIFPFGNMMGGNTEKSGGMFDNMNPMMMMMFMKDGDFGGDDMFKNMMLMQCMSGNGGMGMFGC